MTAPTFDNAFTMLQALLQQWGLESLVGDVRNMLVAGDNEDVIPLKLRETDAYKKRFKANLDRVKAGLPAMSEAEFLATEASLRTVARRYVGAGVLDTRENLDRWIAGDVSAQELNGRMQEYQDGVQQRQNERFPIYDNLGNLVRWSTVAEEWAAHGFTPADALLAVADPNVTESTLRSRLRSYGLGAEALRAYRDTNVLDQSRLGQLADAGITGDDARKAFGEVAGREDYEGFLARSAGTTLSRQEQEDAELLNDQGAARKRKKVLDTALAGSAENYLGGTNELARSRAGTY